MKKYTLELTEREKLILSYSVWRFMNDAYDRLEIASQTKKVKSGNRNVKAEMITEKTALRLDAKDAEKLVGRIRKLEPKS